MDLVHFRWDQDADGIVTLTWDMPGRNVNVLSFAAAAELEKVADALAADAALKGLVLISAKPGMFCAGADLNELGAAQGPDMAAKALEAMSNVHRAFRKLEACKKPVVAAINGTALGGGFEVTLACHARIAVDDPKLRLGFPEAQLGILPGAGGTQRLPRLIGAMAALPLMLESTRIDAQTALAQRIVLKVVPADALLGEAKSWIKANPLAKQPWDEESYRVPGGDPYSPKGSQVFAVGNAMLRSKTYANYPAQQYIMSCVYEGLLTDFDTGLKIEVRYFVKLLISPQAQAMIRTFFFSMQDLGKGARRPKDVPPVDVTTMGVLGAGLMGAGIAYVSALAGITVHLIDTSESKAQSGKDHVAQLLDKQIARGRSTSKKKDEVLARILPSGDYGVLKNAQLVIEAVFEDRGVKADVTKKADAVTGSAAIFGSNTSTLPITGLAEASNKPANFIGIHFFSPVERMELVEIILGKQTGDAALATALDYVRKIKKTPIVVNDSRGFYTSRCFSTYTAEGMLMVGEGIAPPLVENAGRMAGMPMGPLEIIDSVGADTGLKIVRQTRKEVTKSETPEEGEQLLAWLVEQKGRPGQKTGKGFYEYDDKGKRMRLWPEFLARGEGKWRIDADVRELELRMLTIQALEAARCFEEGVITDPREADVGAILGWGFAPYTGGPLSYIDMIGAAEFVRRCEDFAKRFGKRFTPNAQLRAMAAKNETYYPRAKAKNAA
jgi:3-hydroxyacyl-CoA dehydrogenase/enoyl-CoA hydratase/3-hydroxybutyryl-CoA epimerase